MRLEQDYPEPARALRAAIAAADGLLIVSPEYNHAVPGVLQNAIDWASRPPDQPFKGKPVAIMGASTGRLGTVRMQHSLRTTLDSLEAHTLLKPEVMVGDARDCFDETCLIDDKGREIVARLMTAFEVWVRRFAPVARPARADPGGGARRAARRAGGRRARLVSGRARTRRARSPRSQGPADLARVAQSLRVLEGDLRQQRDLVLREAELTPGSGCRRRR